MVQKVFPDFATTDIADIGNGDPNKEPISAAHKTDGWGVEKPTLQQMNQLQSLQGHFIRANNEFKIEADGYEAESGEIVLIDNSSGTATGNLPTSPINGQWVIFGGVEKFSIFAVDIEGGTNDIMVAADTNCVLNIDNTLFIFYWDSSASLWKINITALQGKIQ